MEKQDAASRPPEDRGAARAGSPLPRFGTPGAGGFSAAAPATDAAAARMDDIVIGTGVTSNGNFETGGVICIDGVLTGGEVRAATLSISCGGEFHGKALVRYLEVFGTLSGEVIASEQVMLRASAVVTGKLSAPYVVMHRGATITGQVETLERPAGAAGAPR